VPSGEITSLTDGKNVVRIGYGLELKPVPFSIRLVDFEVPRYEGTETPSNFIASVEFQDSATGAVKSGTARMNYPASFPGTILSNFTGINYKFSQAEWNPKDLGETTLQVLYDPGWLFKWLGSLLICVGIAIMFYIKPKSTTRPS
jgi:cytochrome c biogenesis protein ResB